MEFDKSEALFPVKKSCVYLAHCGISPLYAPACEREEEIARAHRDGGALMFHRCEGILDSLHAHAAELMGTSPDNLAFVKNTSEAMSMIACGYPWEPGDRILSYDKEYPANHYPWRVQEEKAVELDLMQSRDLADGAAGGRPCGFTVEDVEAALTDRTRVVAVSHAQFTSGYAVDLEALGALCLERGVDLVVDAAQTLGALPVHPEEWNLAAVAASGWKWLMGPVGTGLMYTSPAFREKLGHVLTGADLMTQGSAYLDHRWQPFASARRFEYSTTPLTLAAALDACIEGTALRYGAEAIRAEVFRLLDRLVEGLDRARYTPVVFPEGNRSGILAVVPRADLAGLIEALEARGVACSGRGGYLRLAPHYCITDAEIDRALEALNAV